MNKWAFVTIFLCFHHIHTTSCKLSLIKDIAVFSYELITLGADVIDRIKSGDDFGKLHETINDLQKNMDELHKKLDYNTQLVDILVSLMEEVPHKTVFLYNIERRINYLYRYFIDGCTALATAEELKFENR